MMNSLRTLLCTLLMMVTLFTSDVDSEMGFFRTKLPHYNRGTLPVPIKPPDFCMLGLCPKQEPHIACQTAFWGPDCEKPHFGIDMDANQHTILGLHNDMRQMLNISNRFLPRATNMKKLRWDESLSLVAMRVTNYCQKVDGFCFNVPRYLNVGKNDFIVKRESLLPKVTLMLNNVFKPLRKIIFDEISKSDVDSFPTNATFMQKIIAQMVSASVSSIGCGMVIRFEQIYSIAYLTCLYDKKLMPGDRLYS